eukprot:SAG31_NODE_1002_length_10448_cov_27.630399_1_plen_285_part_00
MEAAASYWRLPPLVADGSHQRPGAAPDRFRHQSPEIGASSAHTSFAEHVSTAMAEISNGLANLSGTSASGTAGSEDDGSSEGHVELDPHEVRAILRQRAEKEQRRREHLYSRDSTVSPPASPLASPIKKVQIASTNGGASANQSQDASEKPRSLEEEPQTVKPQQFYPDGPDRDTKFLSRVPHPRTRPLSRFAVSSVPDRKWEIPEQLPIGHDNLRFATTCCLCHLSIQFLPILLNTKRGSLSKRRATGILAAVHCPKITHVTRKAIRFLAAFAHPCASLHVRG